MKSLRFFFSMVTTGMLLVVFGLVIALATFVENDHGTAAAWILIYNAWWFEALLFVLAVNLLGSIVVNKLWSKSRWPVGFFHLAFLIILAGGAITRHFSFEGTLHIREGEMNNQLISKSTFLRIEAHSNNDSVTFNEKVTFLPGARNRFHQTVKVGDQTINVSFKGYMPNAVRIPVAAPDGLPMLQLLVVDRDNKPAEILLQSGQVKENSGVSFCFKETPDSSALRFKRQGDDLLISSGDTLFKMMMGKDSTASLPPGNWYPVENQAIYQSGDIGFVLKQWLPSARLEWAADPTGKGESNNDVVKLEIADGTSHQPVYLSGKTGGPGEPVTIRTSSYVLKLQYGSLLHALPFTLFLKDFQLERYPGSQSPSSFASEVVLLDPAEKVEKPYRIFMNNILKYKGYRFFQSSYDPDEKGTLLSVSYNYPGTAVTYFGYLFMTIGILLTFFFKKSRFRKLTAQLAVTNKTPLALAVLISICLTAQIKTVSAQDSAATHDISSQHLKSFALLQVQNVDGRIEPVNTLASELLRKISKKNSYRGLTPVEVMLGMMTNPQKWQNEPIIMVGHPEVAGILGIKGTYASFSNFLDPHQPNGYKLSQKVQEAYAKEPAKRNKFDKEIINVDERINILYKMMQLGYLTIFPIPNDPAHKWVAYGEAHSHPDLAVFATTAMKTYAEGLQKGIQSGSFSDADSALKVIASFQLEKGAAIYPSSFKTNLEIYYVNFNLFKKLALIYLILGLLLLIIQIFNLLSAKVWTTLVNRSGFWIILSLLLLHTAGLGIRWYISGHAPWSNGYETLLYISWSACIAGILFSRISHLALSVTTLLAGLSLLVAGMSWMNPQLTNLVPVLKSYWLIIHVAVITSSYGFLGIGALMAMVNLILYILRNKENTIRVSSAIHELSLIIEMALIIGLYMITIGSFLGGVWANESWGRYWGWDPKETWALVTILVYAFITHMYRIKGLEGQFTFNVAALLGFGSVLMTYFGVNYYLSGLHSYAAGDAPSIPAGVYIGVVALFFLITTSGYSYNKWKKTDSNSGQ
jgi:cytochrome c-type biogenesis protein CcsB